MRARHLIAFVFFAVASHAQQSARVYFPDGVFADGHSAGFSRAGWYGRDLLAIEEEPLVRRDASAPTVYRFTLLPSFSHPIAVRVTLRGDGTADAVWKVGSGQGGTDPGKLLLSDKRSLSKEETQAMLSLLAANDFWQQLSELTLPPNTVQLDGTAWVLEGADHGKYHVVDRFGGGSLRDLGHFFLKDIAGIDPNARPVDRKPIP